jgi:hypothetical protein
MLEEKMKKLAQLTNYNNSTDSKWDYIWFSKIVYIFNVD